MRKTTQTITAALFALLLVSMVMGVIGVTNPLIILATTITVAVTAAVVLPQYKGYAMVCGAIGAEILADQCNAIFSGQEVTIWIMNRADIDYSSIVYDSVTPNHLVVTSLAMKTGKRAYKWEGIKQSHKSSYTNVLQSFRNAYDHSHSLVVFDNTPEVKLQLDGLDNASVVVIYENKYKAAAGEAAFEILGLNVGLSLAEGGRQTNQGDANGGHIRTLTTPEDQKEPYMPRTFYDTSYAATLTKVVALETPAV